MKNNITNILLILAVLSPILTAKLISDRIIKDQLDISAIKQLNEQCAGYDNSGWAVLFMSGATSTGTFYCESSQAMVSGF